MRGPVNREVNTASRHRFQFCLRVVVWSLIARHPLAVLHPGPSLPVTPRVGCLAPTRGAQAAICSSCRCGLLEIKLVMRSVMLAVNQGTLTKTIVSGLELMRRESIACNMTWRDGAQAREDRGVKR